MKALVLTAKNQPPTISEMPDPVPGEDEVVVQIKASALNHRDVWIGKGQYAGIEYPLIPGSDGCGILDGKEVIINPSMNWGESEKFQARNYQILGLPEQGTMAEKVKVDQRYVHPKPDHLSVEEAAAIPLAGLTAYRAMFSRGRLEEKEKVLITGIGGGVALFCLQFALAMNCEVWVTSGSNEKIDRAIELGAVGGSNYKEDWSNEIKAAKFRPDLIIDSAGGDGFASLVDVAAPGGRISLYGGTRGNWNNVSPQKIFWKQLSLLGTTMGSDKDFAEMLDFVNKNSIKPVVDAVFRLDEGEKAFERMDNGEQFGKIVLRHA